MKTGWYKLFRPGECDPVGHLTISDGLISGLGRGPILFRGTYSNEPDGTAKLRIRLINAQPGERIAFDILRHAVRCDLLVLVGTAPTDADRFSVDLEEDALGNHHRAEFLRIEEADPKEHDRIRGLEESLRR